MQPTDEKRETRPPVPPFNEETAWQKVKMAQDAWNTRDPEKGDASINDKIDESERRERLEEEQG